jgi:hypothetical protein
MLTTRPVASGGAIEQPSMSANKADIWAGYETVTDSATSLARMALPHRWRPGSPAVAIFVASAAVASALASNVCAHRGSLTYIELFALPAAARRVDSGTGLVSALDHKRPNSEKRLAVSVRMGAGNLT